MALKPALELGHRDQPPTAHPYDPQLTYDVALEEVDRHPSAWAASALDSAKRRALGG